MSRSARLRWLGSEDCFCCSRQNSTSWDEAKPMSITSLPTSVSRLALRPDALFSACDMSLVGIAAVRWQFRCGVDPLRVCRTARLTQTYAWFTPHVKQVLAHKQLPQTPATPGPAPPATVRLQP